ncbi:MAG TPA: M23 family metallopeptidase, partial [Vicingus sp.]|nr:M23 family metallopeptidase [Vicingus sp.]
MGFWRVSQGYNGKITHKEDYQFALDFDVTDNENKTYKNSGYDLKDYYCFNLPIVAPASGWVVAIIDDVEDNAIKDVNIQQNWGNTVIIKHGEYLFSKLCHLKNESTTVKLGEYVYKGQVIGYCGSSGRSPEPHLHFQMQATPFVGSKTLMHPIDYYLTKNNTTFQFHSFDVPKENEVVCNIIPTTLLTKAFYFIPGQEITVLINNNITIKWEVFVNSLNQTYFYCHKTKAVAYFVNNGTVFYF